ENILFDQGLTPHILHYGVSESIPPYEKNSEQLWEETKAIIAAISDNTHDFYTYLAHYETLKLSETAEKIMFAASHEDILDVIKENINKDIEYERTLTHLPKRKWKVRRYVTWILLICLIPSLAYSAFALFFKIPETNAYVKSNQYFLQNEYSSVIDTLRSYNDEKMPRVVQYELATSYVANESLAL